VYIHSFTAIYSTGVMRTWLEAAHSLYFVAKFVHQLSSTSLPLYFYEGGLISFAST